MTEPATIMKVVVLPPLVLGRGTVCRNNFDSLTFNRFETLLQTFLFK
jgi:hypothetical protein